MTARTTCTCGLPLTDGACGVCKASATRARSFRGWLAWMRRTPTVEGSWVVRGRVIRYVDPLIPDTPDPLCDAKRMGAWWHS